MAHMTASQQSLLVFEEGDELLDRIAQHLVAIGAPRAQILAQGEAMAVEIALESGTAPPTTIDGPVHVLCASGHTDRSSSNLHALVAASGKSPISGRLHCAFMKTGSAVIFAGGASDAAPSVIRTAEAKPETAPAVIRTAEAKPETIRYEEIEPSRTGDTRQPEVGLLGRPMPQKPANKHSASVEEVLYPEEGDIATHFVFGRCLVVFSDGERIRLQQERDGKVREVSLTALRVTAEAPADDGRRQFQLLQRR